MHSVETINKNKISSRNFTSLYDVATFLTPLTLEFFASSPMCP